MLAELKTTDSSNKIQSFYTKEEEYDLVYIIVISLAVLLDSGTAGTPPPSSLRRGRWMLDTNRCRIEDDKEITVVMKQSTTNKPLQNWS